MDKFFVWLTVTAVLVACTLVFLDANTDIVEFEAAWPGDEIAVVSEGKLAAALNFAQLRDPWLEARSGHRFALESCGEDLAASPVFGDSGLFYEVVTNHVCERVKVTAGQEVGVIIRDADTVARLNTFDYRTSDERAWRSVVAVAVALGMIVAGFLYGRLRK